jgi:hypothetical protein
VPWLYHQEQEFKMPLVKVTNSPFVRDTESRVLLNTDENAKNEYLTKVKLLKTQKEEINNVKSEIIAVKEDMAEIKYLLSKLIEKGSNG